MLSHRSYQSGTLGVGIARAPCQLGSGRSHEADRGDQSSGQVVTSLPCGIANRMGSWKGAVQLDCVSAKRRNQPAKRSHRENMRGALSG
jgi:hypothetical protein